jgi:hypothetical protein
MGEDFLQLLAARLRTSHVHNFTLYFIHELSILINFFLICLIFSVLNA